MTKQEKEEKEKAGDAGLEKRLVQALGEPYKAVIEEVQECGFTFMGVESKDGEVILKFEGGEVDCTMYALLLQKFNSIAISVMVCDVGGWPIACTRLKVAMPRQT
jgi:hypothetical protein